MEPSSLRLGAQSTEALIAVTSPCSIDGRLSQSPPSTRACVADEPHLTRWGAARRTRSVGLAGGATPASTAIGAGGRCGAPTEAEPDAEVAGAFEGRRSR